MTIYPDWTEVKCPTCNAGYHQACTAVFTLPKGTTLRNPHGKRLQAYETKINGTTNLPVNSLRRHPSNDSTKSNSD